MQLSLFQKSYISLMNEEEKIQELQRRINELSTELAGSRHTLYILQQELDLLRKAAINTPLPQVNEPLATPVDATGGVENFIGLRLIHLVGIVVLVIGISIGVKYAIDKELISETMRIVLAYAAGAILLFLSYRLKKKYQLFSAILFSGSMASLYFTTYGAFVYYHFLPAPLTFLVMVLLTIYTVATAMNYGRQEIAIFGMTGAYGIPFLISANAERVDLFFSYILLINIGVVYLSFKRSWKLMSYLAMFITWILFGGWAIFRYEPLQQQPIAFIFMSTYYLLFIFNAIAFALRKKIALTETEIQQVIINNIALYIACVLVTANIMVLAEISSTTGFLFLFTAVLAITSVFVFPREILLQKLLSWKALLLLVIFIGLQWDGVTVTLIWLLLSLVLFGWGIMNKRSWPRLAAVLLIGITLIKLLAFDSSSFSTVQKILSFIVIGILLLVFSFYYQRFNLRNSKVKIKK